MNEQSHASIIKSIAEAHSFYILGELFCNSLICLAVIISPFSVLISEKIPVHLPSAESKMPSSLQRAAWVLASFYKASEIFLKYSS